MALLGQGGVKLEVKIPMQFNPSPSPHCKYHIATSQIVLGSADKYVFDSVPLWTVPALCTAPINPSATCQRGTCSDEVIWLFLFPNILIPGSTSDYVKNIVLLLENLHPFKVQFSGFISYVRHQSSQVPPAREVLAHICCATSPFIRKTQNLTSRAILMVTQTFVALPRFIRKKESFTITAPIKPSAACQRSTCSHLLRHLEVYSENSESGREQTVAHIPDYFDG